MRSIIFSRSRRSGLATLVAAGLITLFAAFPRTLRAAATDQGSEVSKLTEAYAVLESADHDYKGHRVHAMKEVKAAIEALGAQVQGDGHGHSQQGSSDEQLRKARETIQAVRTVADNAKQTEVLTHIDAATKQIDVSLSISSK